MRRRADVYVLVQDLDQRLSACRWRLHFLLRGEGEMVKRAAKIHEVSAVRMPGFNAEASLYISPETYRSSGGRGAMIGAVQLASPTCLCTDPNCTWTCPSPPPQNECNTRLGKGGCLRDCMSRCLLGPAPQYCADNCLCCCDEALCQQ